MVFNKTNKTLTKQIVAAKTVDLVVVDAEALVLGLGWMIDHAAVTLLLVKVVDFLIEKLLSYMNLFVEIHCEVDFVSTQALFIAIRQGYKVFFNNSFIVNKTVLLLDD